MSKEQFNQAIREMHYRQQAVAKMASDAARKRYVEVWGRAAAETSRESGRGG